jgi:hypothetical protein
MDSSKEHAHEHEFVEIVDSETITAFELVPHGIITLQLHERGLSLDLTYKEAAALGVVMERVVEHVNARRQH